ncbi:MAG: peptidoglycan DD-metalloendopeptidase family protein [Rhodothalassiaceae bacterium]
MRIHRAHIRDSALALYRRLFPERQIFFRSEGEVHFRRLSPQMQVTAAAIALVALMWILAVSIHYLTGDARLAAKERELQYVSGELDALLGELGRLQKDALARTRKVEQRQRILDSLLGDLPAEGAAEAATAGDAAAAEDGTRASGRASQDQAMWTGGAGGSTVLAALIGVSGARAGAPVRGPEYDVHRETGFLLRRLDAIAAKQEEQAAALARREQRRLAEARHLVARLGLEFDDLLASDVVPAVGTGGPLVAISGDQSSPAFRDLLDLAGTRRQFDAAVFSIPSRIPADNYFVSSRFGQRRDPFRKTWAMHSGVDLAGWPGEPIHAAGEGLVIKAGRAPAYGLMVEIDHGNGFHTRYGHMRKLKVKAGARVDRGTVIGEMGTSGRSTSTHLHWEVWFQGKLVDPMRFMEASKDVYALQTQVRSNG